MKQKNNLENTLNGINTDNVKFLARFEDLKYELDESKDSFCSKLTLLNQVGQNEDISLILSDFEYSQGEKTEINIHGKDIAKYGQKILDYFSKIEKKLIVPELHNNVYEFKTLLNLMPKSFEKLGKYVLKSIIYFALPLTGRFTTPKKALKDVKNDKIVLEIIEKESRQMSHLIRQNANAKNSKYSQAIEFYEQLNGATQNILLRYSNVVKSLNEVLGYENN